MDREHQRIEDERIELGVASEETQGPPGGTFEISGLARHVGISDE